MPHLFESKNSFKENFKEAVSDAYGRDFEDTYPALLFFYGIFDGSFND